METWAKCDRQTDRRSERKRSAPSIYAVRVYRIIFQVLTFSEATQAKWLTDMHLQWLSTAAFTHVSWSLLCRNSCTLLTSAHCLNAWQSSNNNSKKTKVTFMKKLKHIQFGYTHCYSLHIMCLFTYLVVQSFVYLFMHWFILLLIRFIHLLPMYWCIHAYLFIHFLICLLKYYSFTYVFIYF
jgi:hypothetical protein